MIHVCFVIAWNLYPSSKDSWIAGQDKEPVRDPHFN